VKSKIPLFVQLGVVALTIAGLALAAPQKRGKGPFYDPATVTTIEGVVTGKVEVPWGDSNCWGGEHLLVKTDAGTSQVHVGPTWYLLRNDWKFAEGDRLTVTGSQIQVEDTKAIIARTIKRGDKQIELRDANGIPAWARKKK